MGNAGEGGQATGSQFGPAARDTDPGSVLNKTWQWEGTITPVEKITVPSPDRYTILLMDGGRLQARFDCNRGGGDYKISAGTLLKEMSRGMKFMIKNMMLLLSYPWYLPGQFSPQGRERVTRWHGILEGMISSASLPMLAGSLA